MTLAGVDQAEEGSAGRGREGVFELSFGRRQDWYSDQSYRLLGLDKALARAGEDLLESRIHPDDAGLLDDALSALHDPGHDRHEEVLRVRDGRGSYLLLRWEAQCLERDVDGWPARVVGTLRDASGLGRPRTGQGGPGRLPSSADEETPMDAGRGAPTAERPEGEDGGSAPGAADPEADRTGTIRSDRLRALGEMATAMAHELNQPLVGVRGLAEHLLLAMDRGWPLEEATAREKLLGIIGQADRMVRTIDHLRAFARESGKRTAQPVDVNEVVDRAASLFRAQLAARGIGLGLDLAPDLPRVSANPYSLEEALLALVTNARDALEALGPEGSDARRRGVRVRSRAVGDARGRRVLIEVVDSGPGIAADLRDRVFEPFFTTKGPSRGAGLGLHVCRLVVEEAGGRVRLDPSPEGGVTATVELPAVEG